LRELKPLDETAKSPQEIWLDYFSKRVPSEKTLRETVFKLHNSRRHDHVIALIEAALIHGQPRPWMYEVLAISYELAGRPKEDIERALLSAVDPNVDFESMMYSSAYLSRFNNKRPALRMYQQASRQNPVRPEPYILGLRLARDLNDVDAIEWAAVGILNYAWQDHYEELHRQAEIGVKEALVLLEEQGRPERARQLMKAVADARIRDLAIEMTWNGAGDVDLIVVEPGGTTANWMNTHTAYGGVHLGDGFGPKQENCVEKYVCTRAQPGRYLIRVSHVWGKVVAGKVRVKVTKHQGSPEESTKLYTVTVDAEDQLLQIFLEEGRRENPNPALEDNRQSKLQLWNPRRKVAGLSPFHLNPQQRQVLRQFINPGQAGGGFGTVPFVTGAVGYAPIITQIATGSMMGASAVVSADRRYVRIGVNPIFSEITNVIQFSLNGGGVQNSTSPNGN